MLTGKGMDSSSTPHKEKKGLSRLWTKVKLAVRSKSKPTSKTTTTTTTTDTPQPSSATQTQPIPAQRYTQPDQPTTSVSDHHSAPTQPQPQQPVELPTSETQPFPTSTMPTAIAPVELPAHPDSDEQPGESSTSHPVDARMVDVTPTSAVESAGPRDEKDEHNRRCERAQAIFKKYNMEFDEAGWEMRPNPQGERVHKAPRMRVRWTCHECKTTFGHDKICVECAHQRCRNCPRYPPKKKKAKAAKKAAASTAVTTDLTQQEAPEGTCHECQTTFDLGTPECSNCHHPICERCLQETVSSAEHGEAQAMAATAAS